MSAQTSTFTEVYFHHLQGGSILKHKTLSVNFRGPFLSAKTASPFRIIPLNDQNEPMSSSCWTISTKEEYYKTLKSEDWKNVAIQNDEGQHISCRRKNPAGGALAEYRDEIGAFEKFQVHYNESSNAFSFQSHNGLYLHYNRYAQIIAFKEREKDWAAWIINPFQLQDPTDDYIRFLGVVNHEGEFLMRRNCIIGSQNPWSSQIMFKALIGMLASNMRGKMSKDLGSCTIFEGDEGNVWYVTMTKENILNVAIASPDCPHCIGALCVEEIETVFDKCESMDLEKDLDHLMIDIANQFRFATTGILKDKFKSYDDQMKENIVKLQDNQEHVQDLIACYDELKHVGQKCYDKLQQVPGDKWMRGAKKTPDVLVKGMANLAGSFAGSRFGSKILKNKADLIVDVTSNLDLEKNGPIYKFWCRRFISFGTKLEEAEVDLTSKNAPSEVPPFPMAMPNPPPVPSAPPLPGN